MDVVKCVDDKVDAIALDKLAVRVGGACNEVLCNMGNAIELAPNVLLPLNVQNPMPVLETSVAAVDQAARSQRLERARKRRAQLQHMHRGGKQTAATNKTKQNKTEHTASR